MDLLLNADALTWLASLASRVNWVKALDVAGLIIGLVYLWLEYNASARLWIVSVIMPIVHGALYFERGLYADFGMELYYIAIAVYGFVTWKYGHHDPDGDERRTAELPITHYKRSHIAPSIAVFAVLWIGIYLFLSRMTNSTVPVCDAFTTALSMVAMWALARKYAEQWLLWLVVDAVSTVLYVYKQIPFTAVLYAFYTVMAVFGYLKWLRLMRQSSTDLPIAKRT